MHSNNSLLAITSSQCVNERKVVAKYAMIDSPAVLRQSIAPFSLQLPVLNKINADPQPNNSESNRNTTNTPFKKLQAIEILLVCDF